MIDSHAGSTKTSSALALPGAQAVARGAAPAGNGAERPRVLDSLDELVQRNARNLVRYERERRFERFLQRSLIVVAVLAVCAVAGWWAAGLVEPETWQHVGQWFREQWELATRG